MFNNLISKFNPLLKSTLQKLNPLKSFKPTSSLSNTLTLARNSITSKATQITIAIGTFYFIKASIVELDQGPEEEEGMFEAEFDLEKLESHIKEIHSFLAKTILENGEKSQLVAGIYFNLGQAYAMKGDINSCKKYFEKCLSVTSSLYGDQSGQYATAILKLHEIWLHTGDLTRAIEKLKQGLAIKIKELGEFDQVVGLFYSALGKVELFAQNGKNSVENYMGAYRVYEKIGPEAELNKLTSLRNAALGYAMINDKANALAKLKEAYDGLVKILGDDHPLVLNLQNDIYNFENWEPNQDSQATFGFTKSS